MVLSASMPGSGLRDTRALTANGLVSSRPAGPVLRSEGSQWAVSASRMWRLVFSAKGNGVPDTDLMDYPRKAS